MAYPNFNLKSVTDKQLKNVTITRHVCTPRTMPVDVARQVANHTRIWTWGKFDHEITVTFDGVSMTHRWNCDSTDDSSLSRRYLAERVYSMRQRMAVSGKKAA